MEEFRKALHEMKYEILLMPANDLDRLVMKARITELEAFIANEELKNFRETGYVWKV